MQEQLDKLKAWASSLWARIVVQWNKFLNDNRDM
jgi:hypothetical protein